ncbi:MAG: LysR substrate-binding domain-containing protein, partial [Sulfurimicrobium sp.]|nr:LysR substrate-binding domain-containing protein [Sulfurimicrobium sp.]
QLKSVVCCEDELVMICSPQHPLGKLSEIAPALLAEQPYISRESGSGTRNVVDDYFRQANVSPEDLHIVMELGSLESIKGAVEAGLGVAIVSRSTILKELKLGDLVAVSLNPPLIRPLSVVFADGKFRSRLLQAFLDYAADRLKD